MPRPQTAALKTPTIEATVLIDGESVPARVRVNRRAKHIILKVDPLTRTIILTSPTKRLASEALAFASKRSSWIKEQLSSAAGPKPFTADGVFPFRGHMWRIINEGPARRPIQADPDDRTLRVGGDAAHVNRRVGDWLKRQARDTFTERADNYATLIGAKRGPIRIRDMRSRWGSCGSDGVLTFSWRLVLAPDWIIDYVTAHECAHLIHLDHSRAFWALVKEMGVDASAARTWFDEKGADLFGWGVSA